MTTPSSIIVSQDTTHTTRDTEILENSTKSMNLTVAQVGIPLYLNYLLYKLMMDRILLLLQTPLEIPIFWRAVQNL